MKFLLHLVKVSMRLSLLSLGIGVGLNVSAKDIHLKTQTAGASIYGLAIRSDVLNEQTIEKKRDFLGTNSAILETSFGTRYILVEQSKDGYVSNRIALSTKEREYLLPALRPCPKMTEGQMELVFKEVNIHVPSSTPMYENFASFKDYDKEQVQSSKYYTENFYRENTDLSTNLNRELSKYHYLDSTKIRMGGFSPNAMGIAVNVTELKTVNIAGVINFVEINATWKINDPYKSGVKYEKRIKSFSRHVVGPMSTEEIGICIEEALKDGLVNMLTDAKALKAIEKSNNLSPTNYWTDINVQNQSMTVGNGIANSAKSVVTVVVKGGHGSGCILSKDGLIVTNFHVAGDSASKVQIIYENGKKDSARVIRANPAYDLSLLKVDRNDLFPLVVDLNREIKLGSEVYAIGTPRDIELGQTLTKGIISGRRKFDEKTYLQSDVSISPGNSGGAMLNKDGALIGVVNAKMVGKGVEGVGFAIPSFYLEEALKLKFTN